MKVLMITPLVDENHSILGFIPTWIRNLAEKVDTLFVITPQYNIKTLLPENVVVYAINGESKRISKVSKLIHFVHNQLYFNYLILRTIPEVDVVFTHMSVNPTIIIAPYAKLFRTPLIAWYAHGHVTRRLRVACFLANKMVTASKESLRLKSNKIVITGHGIDTYRFKPVLNQKRIRDKKIILSVGRISPIKDYDTLIKAADILVNNMGLIDLEFIIVGGVPVGSQIAYYEKLIKMVDDLELKDYVKFIGSVPHTEVAKYYQECDIHVNLCPTGGADKAVLEAMACEKLVLVCNETFKDMLKPFDILCLFKYSDYTDLAEKLKNILDKEYLLNKIELHNRVEVENNHSISHLTNSLVEVFGEVIRNT